MSEGRQKADKAKENLPEIRRLIDLANDNTEKANNEIGNAQNDVKDATDIANRGKQTSLKTEAVSCWFTVEYVKTKFHHRWSQFLWSYIFQLFQLDGFRC